MHHASDFLRMLILKAIIYSATFTAAMFFGFWELQLKQHLTQNAGQPTDQFIDYGIMDHPSERMRREQVLKTLPKEALSKFKLIARLKFLLVAILIAEVCILQG